MKTHLNTLFVTLEGAYLRKDGAAVEVRHDGATKLRVPLHNLDGIATFGWDTTASAALMHACAEANVALSFHSPHGKFLANTQGPISGNVLLRRAQYRAADHEPHSVSIARNLIAAKLANTRTLLQTQGLRAELHAVGLMGLGFPALVFHRHDVAVVVKLHDVALAADAQSARDDRQGAGDADTRS